LTSYTTAVTVWGQDAGDFYRRERAHRKVSDVEAREFPRVEDSAELRGLAYRRYVTCPHCGKRRPEMRRRCVRRACESYGDLWAGDQRMRLFGALQSYGDQVGAHARVTMVTVTAPGSELGLPWDRDHCASLGAHRHSGRIGCRVIPRAAALWNERAPANWTALHRGSGQAVKRLGLDRPRLLVKAWEYQKRGVLHLHLVFGYSSPSEQRSVDAYVSAMAERAQSVCFGFVDRKREVREPSAAAAYLSSYFVAGKGSKMDIRETVRREDVPSHVIYIAPWLLQHSGLSMRTLRLRRYLWWKIGAGGLRLCQRIGISLEDAYQVYSSGFWGPAFLNSYIESSYGHT
jgi:hypothetical protein